MSVKRWWSWLYYSLFFLLFLTTARHNGFLQHYFNFIIPKDIKVCVFVCLLSPFYRTYYKASIKFSTSVERGYYKELHTRLSDINHHFRQVTKKVTKNRRFSPLVRIGGESVGGFLLIMPVMTAPANHTHYSAWTGTFIIARFIRLFVPPNFNMSIKHRVLRV